MARPRAFDHSDVLERAMQVFWSKGYAATSLADLTAAMGLSKSSLYDSFGSKHDLFLQTIDYYRETVTKRMRGVVDLQAPAGQVITSVLRRAVDRIMEPDGRRGCYLNNSAVEVGPWDADAAARCRAGMALMEEAFHQLVERGQREGGVSTRHDPRALARFLNSTVNGVMVIGKTNPDRDVLDDIVSVALRALH
ncbi:MAG: TetR/AcrR family transcriptional regulator [Magnetovibrio sp.]|nr:TetR/AcrR family transcriptional regulator [Magnetovibrio sp.]